MNTRQTNARQSRENQRGFTLPEIMVASTVFLIVVSGLLTSFVWMVRMTERCNRYASVQGEARRSAQLITQYIRNGLQIHSVDISGNWVQIVMTNAASTNTYISRFAYISDPTASGLGRMLFTRDIDNATTTNVIARSLTKVMTLPTRNIFEVTGSNSVRVAYRISAPHPNNSEAGAEVDTGVRLKNY